MAAALREHGVGETWTWNVDRYIRKGTHPYMEAGDIVLQWQPKRDAAAPAGVYARGIVLDAPCYQPDDDGKWTGQGKILEGYNCSLLKSDACGEGIRGDSGGRRTLQKKNA